jgi:hypothetical protein
VCICQALLIPCATVHFVVLCPKYLLFCAICHNVHIFRVLMSRCRAVAALCHAVPHVGQRYGGPLHPTNSYLIVNVANNEAKVGGSIENCSCSINVFMFTVIMMLITYTLPGRAFNQVTSVINTFCPLQHTRDIVHEIGGQLMNGFYLYQAASQLQFIAPCCAPFITLCCEAAIHTSHNRGKCVPGCALT